MRIDKKTIVGISFVLATLLGNGALWQYGQYRIEKQRIELETEKISIERISEAIKLREKLNDLFYKITNLAGEYQNALLAKSEGKNKIGSFTIEQRILLLNTELDQLIDDFQVGEANLAKLENRQPRKINLQFRPPGKPKGIRLEGEWE